MSLLHSSVALRSFFLCTALLMLPVAAQADFPSPPAVAGAVPMDAEHWQVGPHGTFGTLEASGTRTVTITASDDTSVIDVDRAQLRGVSLTDGTVEFDTRQSDGDIGGLLFRQTSDRDAEWLYVRLNEKCASSGECLQYAPQRHGLMEWELFAGSQSSAPVSSTGWNHIRVVFGGRRMAVFVNGAVRPSLVAGLLSGTVRAGGLALLGPGVFANVIVRRGVLKGLPTEQREARDRLVIRNWTVQTSPFGIEDTPAKSELPAAGTWRPIRADQNGLVNLSTQLGSPLGTRPAIAWLKTRIYADSNQTRKAAIGWVRQVSVFVNGTPIYRDQNLFGTPEKRKAPGGRVSLENGSFNLPLRKGYNVVVVGVGNRQRDHASRYGWGAMLRLDKRDGLHWSER